MVLAAAGPTYKPIHEVRKWYKMKEAKARKRLDETTTNRAQIVYREVT